MDQLKIRAQNIIASYFLYNKTATSLSMRVLEVLTSSVEQTLSRKWTAIDITQQSLKAILTHHGDLFVIDKKTGDIILTHTDRTSLQEEIACAGEFALPHEVRHKYLGLMKEISPTIDALVSSEHLAEIK